MVGGAPEQHNGIPVLVRHNSNSVASFVNHTLTERFPKKHGKRTPARIMAGQVSRSRYAKDNLMDRHMSSGALERETQRRLRRALTVSSTSQGWEPLQRRRKEASSRRTNQYLLNLKKLQKQKPQQSQPRDTGAKSETRTDARTIKYAGGDARRDSLSKTVPKSSTCFPKTYQPLHPHTLTHQKDSTTSTPRSKKLHQTPKSLATVGSPLKDFSPKMHSGQKSTSKRSLKRKTTSLPTLSIPRSNLSTTFRASEVQKPPPLDSGNPAVQSKRATQNRLTALSTPHRGGSLTTQKSLSSRTTLNSIQPPTSRVPDRNPRSVSRCRHKSPSSQPSKTSTLLKTSRPIRQTPNPPPTPPLQRKLPQRKPLRRKTPQREPQRRPPASPPQRRLSTVKEKIRSVSRPVSLPQVGTKSQISSRLRESVTRLSKPRVHRSEDEPMKKSRQRLHRRSSMARIKRWESSMKSKKPRTPRRSSRFVINESSPSSRLTPDPPLSAAEYPHKYPPPVRLKRRSCLANTRPPTPLVQNTSSSGLLRKSNASMRHALKNSNPQDSSKLSPSLVKRAARKRSDSGLRTRTITTIARRITLCDAFTQTDSQDVQEPIPTANVAQILMARHLRRGRSAHVQNPAGALSS